MNYIVQDQEVVLQHWPGKGAWTYHLVIPNSRDLPGTWGHIKVRARLTTMLFKKGIWLPVKTRTRCSLNAPIRQHLGK